MEAIIYIFDDLYVTIFCNIVSVVLPDLSRMMCTDSNRFQHFIFMSLILLFTGVVLTTLLALKRRVGRPFY